jgi:chromosome segregation ATPase
MLKAIARFIIRKELEYAEKTIENLLEDKAQQYVIGDIYRDAYDRDQAKIQELEHEVRKQSAMIETYENNTYNCYDKIEELEQEQRELKERIATLLLENKDLRDAISYANSVVESTI